MRLTDRRRGMGSKGQQIIDYSTQYLTFEALEAGTFTLTIASGLTTSNLTSVSYSMDGGTNWTTVNNVDNQEVTITTPSIAVGGKVLWKGVGLKTANDENVSSNFSSTGKFNAYGNIMSLLYADFDSRTNMGITPGLFYGSNLVSAANLVFPPTTIVYNQYRAMFRNCIYLTEAPSILPSLSLAGSYFCYDSMFRGCTSLRTAPQLPATTLGNNCYQNMFNGCISLVTAPDLPALTLTNNCYYGMFGGCTSLNYIEAMFTSIASNSITNWLYNVASSGTFVKNSAATWTDTGASGVPTGWTVEYADS